MFTVRYELNIYKVVQIWPGRSLTCLHTYSPGHIWTTLYTQFRIIVFLKSKEEYVNLFSDVTDAYCVRYKKRKTLRRQNAVTEF